MTVKIGRFEMPKRVIKEQFSHRHLCPFYCGAV